MDKIIRGKAFVYGSNIDTDQIYPGRFLDITNPEEVGKHAMEGVDPSFFKEVRQGDIIVASTNFGCGSSREHAAITLKAVGISAILADSFARIFFRNAINLGIPVLICPGIAGMVCRGDIISVDIITCRVANETTGTLTEAQAISDYVLKILESGGIKPLIKSQMVKNQYCK